MIKVEQLKRLLNIKEKDLKNLDMEQLRLMLKSIPVSLQVTSNKGNVLLRSFLRSSADIRQQVFILL